MGENATANAACVWRTRTSERISMRDRMSASASRASAAVARGRRSSVSAAKWAMRPDAQVKAQNQEVADKFKEVRLRSDCVYYSRSAFAWAVNFYGYIHVGFNCFVYGAMFGPEATNDLLKSWAISFTWAIGILEPFNIFMVAAMPLMFSEDSCCFKCYERVFGF